jgi:hypothetical protein
MKSFTWEDRSRQTAQTAMKASIYLPYESARLDGRRIQLFYSIKREKKAKKMRNERMKERRNGSRNKKKFSASKTTISDSHTYDVNQEA